jgi:hypothetical protein
VQTPSWSTLRARDTGHILNPASLGLPLLGLPLLGLPLLGLPLLGLPLLGLPRAGAADLPERVM